MGAGAQTLPRSIRLRGDLRLQEADGSLLGHDAVLHCDGKHYTLSPRLTELVRLIQQHDDLQQLTGRANAQWGTTFDAEALWQLIEGHLGHFLRCECEQGAGGPQVAACDEASADTRRRAPQSAIGGPELWLNVVVMPERWVRAVVPRLYWLLSAPVVWVGSLAAAACLLWAYVDGFAFTRGLRAEYIFYGYAQVALIALWHELGHATAYRRFFGTSGPIYLGLYYVLPAMYVRVPDSYGGRLRHRLWVDLGGVYFQWLLFIPLCLAYGVGVLPRPLYLVGVTVNGLMILLNVNPLLKFDGYWLLTNVLGVHNLSKNANRSLLRVLGLGDDDAGTIARMAQARRWIVPFLALFAALRGVFLGGFVLFIAVQLPDGLQAARAKCLRLGAIVERMVEQGVDVPLLAMALGEVFQLAMLGLMLRIVFNVVWPALRLLGRWCARRTMGFPGAPGATRAELESPAALKVDP